MSMGGIPEFPWEGPVVPMGGWGSSSPFRGGFHWSPWGRGLPNAPQRWDVMNGLPSRGEGATGPPPHRPLSNISTTRHC